MPEEIKNKNQPKYKRREKKSSKDTITATPVANPYS
jgi:hypothetical protein